KGPRAFGGAGGIGVTPPFIALSGPCLTTRSPNADWGRLLSSAADQPQQRGIQRKRRRRLEGRRRGLLLALRGSRGLLVRHVKLLGWGRTPYACDSIPAATPRSRNCQ